MNIIKEKIIRLFLAVLFFWNVSVLSSIAEGNTNNQAEKEDDIVCAFFYPWYRNPRTSGYWRHWPEGGHSPHRTWSSNYLPNYPNSDWNPSVQLYDSSDSKVLRWQDGVMGRAGIDIAIASWWGAGGYEDAAFSKAIRTCKYVQWCIYYEPEGYEDPSPQKIFNDITYVIDRYGQTRNYAKIDKKWLVFVYVAIGEDVASRWSEAKRMLASRGYDVYLSGDRAIPTDPWDSIHSYTIRYQGFTNGPTDVDNSAWICPGFWKYKQNPQLGRYLGDFITALNNISDEKQHWRFALVVTWNEWHEGTQIEPGQEIVPNPAGYYPKENGNYGYDFIDAIGPTAINDLHWTSSGHRPSPPVYFKAGDLIWEDEAYADPKDPNTCIIPNEDIRIGSSVFVQTPSDLYMAIQAKSFPRETPLRPRRGEPRPQTMLFYLDNEVIAEFEADPNYQKYSAITHIQKGIHKIEISLGKPVEFTGLGLAVKCLDITAEPNNITDPS